MYAPGHAFPNLATSQLTCPKTVLPWKHDPMIVGFMLWDTFSFMTASRISPVRHRSSTYKFISSFYSWPKATYGTHVYLTQFYWLAGQHQGDTVSCAALHHITSQEQSHIAACRHPKIQGVMDVV
jgi:hypothetical protein